ncbi:MAG: FimV/HubP family polar landmark protein [Rhodanobacteraceae bacterium]
MKRPLQISLAIALLAAAFDAFALGLGPIRVESGLDQPLKAEIPIIESAADAADGLVVTLASAADFERVGLDRARVSVPLEFSVAKDSRGQPVINVTSDVPVREPFVDFLIEANWPKGRLLREYTALLDPPVMAPATSGVRQATTTPSRARPPTSQQPLPQSKPVAHPAEVPSTSRRASRAAVTTANPDQYGPVAAGETLSGIIRKTGGDSTDVNRMMLAMLKANPDAFFGDNINNLKRGAILRIPAASEIAAVGSAAEAAAQVRAQVEQWRAAATPHPTLVAETGGKPAAQQNTAKGGGAATKSANSERLELVPPKVDRNSVAANRPGGGNAASAAARASLDADLARTKEALSSSNQEAANLKSRVKELEDIKSKNDRLLSLKNSEIADLQEQLRKLREQGSQNGETSVAEHPTSAPAKPTANEDIFGTAASGNATPAGSATPPPAPATPNAQGPAPTESSATAPVSESEQPSAEHVSPTTVAAQPAAGTAAKPATTMASGTPANVATPVQSETPTIVHPRPQLVSPWYAALWVKVAIATILLLLVFGLLLSRRARPKPETRSIAAAFGDSPMAASEEETEDVDEKADDEDAEEDLLHEQIRRDPYDLGAHLELLSIYYARHDVEAFEAAAQEMAAHVDNPEEPEWQQVKAMGEELAPDNLLFAGPEVTSQGAADDRDAAQSGVDDTSLEPTTAEREADTVVLTAADAHFHTDQPTRTESPSLPESSTQHAALDAFDDASSRQDEEVPALLDEPELSVAEHDIGEDAGAANLPPLEFDGGGVEHVDSDAETDNLARKDTAPPTPAPADEFFPSDDAVGTKLDLARAYVDMGDPEGARSMLEEVLSEGNATQQEDARKLIAELS